MRYDVIALGEPVIDFVPVGENNMTFQAYAGGGAVNMLAEASAMGARVALVGAVGNDRFGEFLLGELGRRKIDITGVHRTSRKLTGIGFVSLGANGERSFVTYRDFDADAELFSPEKKAVIKEGKIFHFTTVSMVGDFQRKQTMEAVAYAKKIGSRISFDVNYRAEMWQDTKDFMTCMKWAVEMSDIVKMSEEELNLWVNPEEGHMENFNWEYLTDRLQQAYPDKIFLITFGGQGSEILWGAEKVWKDSFSVRAVDTNGCGDAFVGNALSSLAELGTKFPGKEELDRILRYANAAGAICATRHGALTAMPDKKEIEEFLRRIGEPV